MATKPPTSHDFPCSGGARSFVFLVETPGWESGNSDVDMTTAKL